MAGTARRECGDRVAHLRLDERVAEISAGDERAQVGRGYQVLDQGGGGVDVAAQLAPSGRPGHDHGGAGEALLPETRPPG